MGIQGLLSFLDKASRPASISEYSGCTVAIDSYCWLHKGAFSCAEKLARGEKTDQYVKYCMKFVNMLLSFNIKPILVFDGRHLPAKAETEKKRRELRESNRKKAAELLRLERETEARSLIQRCVDVTHDMALALMKECRAQGVDCIVAPYEADAQLAFLNLNGFAHVVITEDSDLLLFGCKLVLFKMDVYGNGVLVEQNQIPLAMKQHPNQFSMDKFRYMCILSGCDYLKSLPGIGLAKACKFIKKTQDENISRALTRLGAYLNMPNLEVTVDYREKFVDAVRMFKHQPVFDPRTRAVVPLTPLPAGEPIPLPATLDPQISYQLALGNLNPFTLERVDSWDPDQPQRIKTTSWKRTAHQSIWSQDYVPPKPLAPKPDPRDVKPPSTQGKSLSQPVSSLTNRITKLPPNIPNVKSALSKLRESFSVKSPPSKKQCLEDSDSGVGSSSSQEELTPEVVREPTSEEGGLTVDDVLREEGSPVLVGGQWRNPFHANRPPVRNSASPGGALDMFSKLKRTHVEAACVVQSRYFSSGSTNVCAEPKKSPEGKQNNKASGDLNETLLEIINSTPSPKRKPSFLLKRNSSLSPRKNLFEVIDSEEYKQRRVNSPGSKDETPKGPVTPKKNVFSVTSPPTAAEESLWKSPSSTGIEDKAREGVDTSPRQQSFLKILDEVSKEESVGTLSRAVPSGGAVSGGVPKSIQPLLDNPKKPVSLIGLYKPKPKLPLLSKNPKGLSKKAAASSSRGRPSLPDNANFKQKPPTTTNQASLLSIFSFQPKPKLKTP